MKETTTLKLIILISIFLMAFENIAFFSNVLNVYPININNFYFCFL